MATDIGAVHLRDIGEQSALALGIDALTGHVVQTQNNVLRRHDDGFAVRRRQDVVGRHHQRTRFQLGFQCQWDVYGHLVAVEVGVVSSTYQRVQLNRFTLNQHRLKGLDSKAVQGWCAVEQHRVLANHLGEDIPHFRWLALYHLLGSLDSRCQTAGLQLAKDKWLEQFQGHLFRQSALVQAQGRANHNNGTAGVIYPLSKQVLAESALLTLDHISQGFQWALVGTGDGATTATVIQQRVD